MSKGWPGGRGVSQGADMYEYRQRERGGGEMGGQGLTDQHLGDAACRAREQVLGGLHR